MCVSVCAFVCLRVCACVRLCRRAWLLLPVCAQHKETCSLLACSRLLACLQAIYLSCCPVSSVLSLLSPGPVLTFVFKLPANTGAFMNATPQGCYDIRSREIKNAYPQDYESRARLFVRCYRANEGTEFFLTVELPNKNAASPDDAVLMGLCRCALVRFGRCVAPGSIRISDVSDRFRDTRWDCGPLVCRVCTNRFRDTR